MSRIAVFGGVYSNHLALRAVLEDIARRDFAEVHCLGDLGAFGPHPDKVFSMLLAARVRCIQGNYDHSVGNGLDDCGCGYTDPRDNHYAQISYDYTFAHTSEVHRKWLAELPTERKLQLGRYRVHLCHGSPRRVNEFLWESATPDVLLEKFLAETESDVLAFTHTGLRWHRALPGDRHAVNVGVIGRPENDGSPAVRYAIFSADPDFSVEWVSVEYDHEALAREMEAEALPAEFVETIRTGWWTTCLEIMPAKERAGGRH